MNVIGHNNEIVQFEAMLGEKFAKNFDEQSSIALRLQQSLAHARFRRGEKSSRWVENVGWRCVSAGMSHSRG
jgi:hypothetical protein